MKKYVLVVCFLMLASPCFAEKIIVIYKPNKEVSIIHPAYKTRIVDESLMDFLERTRLKATKGTSSEDYPYDIMDSDNLPDIEDREYWEGEIGEGVIIDTVDKNKTEIELAEIQAEQILINKKIKDLAITALESDGIVLKHNKKEKK